MEKIELEDIFAAYPDCLKSSQNLETIMDDVFENAYQLQIKLIVDAYKQGIDGVIRNASVLDLYTAQNLCSRLQSNCGLSSENAEWAVRFWYIAYGQKVLQKPFTLDAEMSGRREREMTQREAGQQRKAQEEELRRELARIQRENAELKQRIVQFEQSTEDAPHVAVSTKEFEIKGGVLIAYHGGEENVVIPVGVTEIGRHAFVCCKNLVSVIIPDSVTKIKEGAFSGCANLKIIAIPDGVTEIGSYAFFNCGLTSVSIPQGVTKIGIYTFRGCKKLSNITFSDSIQHIDSCAFEDCESLKCIMLPPSICSIDACAFKGVSATVYYPAGCLNAPWVGKNYGGKLTWREEPIALQENLQQQRGAQLKRQVKNIPPVSKELASAAKKTSQKIANATDFEIKYGELIAYHGCGGDVVIPEGVTKIGVGAFHGCKSLVSVRIPSGVKYIGNWAFCGCQNLASIHIPSGVKYIGNWAFEDCKNLSKITLPDSIWHIGEDAFKGITATVYYPKNCKSEWWARKYYGGNLMWIAQ